MLRCDDGVPVAPRITSEPFVDVLGEPASTGDLADFELLDVGLTILFGLLTEINK